MNDTPAATSPHRDVQNAIALYAAQGLRFVFPLILLPYLTNTLGAALWGVVAVGQSYGILIERVVQYGFLLTGARDIAAAQDDPQRQAKTVAGVQGAKIVLAVGVAIVTAVTYRFVPVFSDYPSVAAGALFVGLVNGFSFFWYFQGVERMAVMSVLEITARCLGLVLVVVFVRGPEDVGYVLFALGSGLMLSLAIAIVLLYRMVPWQWPTAAATVDELRSGWTCFVSRLWGVFALSANAFLFGFFATPAQVSVYAIGERVANLGGQLVGVVSQLFFPKAAAAVEADPVAYRQLWWRAFYFHIAAAAAVAGGMIVLAPWVVPFLIDTDIDETVRAVQWLACFPAMVAIGNCFMLLVVLVLKKDSAYLATLAAGAIVNVSLIPFLAPAFGAMGMVYSVIISNTIVCVAAWYFAMRTGALRAEE